MKKLSYFTGILLLTFGFSLTTAKSYSQETKLTRQDKKEARRAELYANFQSLDTLLGNKTFIIEANYLQNAYGGPIPVSSMLNFIKVDQPRVVLQTGNNGRQGYNGVGGVTAEGNLQNWKITKDLKHLNYRISFSVMTDIGTYDIFILIGADNTANATITGMTRGRLTYQGNVVAIYNSAVYKGQRTII
jgi:hypothetical protein